MPLQNLHDDWGREALEDINGNAATSYTQARNNLLKISENDRLFAGFSTRSATDPHNIEGIHDVRGNPTIGYGYDLSQRSFNEIEAFITHAFGGTLTTDQHAGIDLIEAYKDPQNPNHISATTLIEIAQGQTGTPSQQAALISLRMSDAEATILLNASLDGFGQFDGFEDELSTLLGGANDVAQSVERIALISADYNANLVGNEIRDAIQSADPSNRAEVWYQLRYNHTDTGDQSIQARRAEEADLFGLLGNHPPANSAQEIADTKTGLNHLFNGVDQGNRDIYNRIQGRDQLDNFEDAIGPALDVLEANFTVLPGASDPVDVDFVQQDAAMSNSLLDAKPATGKDDTNTINLIFGEDGFDIINGKGAQDFLYGGAGNDTFSGDGILASASDAGDDLIVGGDGIDTVSYAAEGGSGNGITVAVSQNTTPQGEPIILVTDPYGKTDTLIGVEARLAA